MTDAEVSGPVDPHAAAPDEDPLEHIGPEIPDPWADDAQADWRTVDIGPVNG